MCYENFKCVGPGEALAYLRRDLRLARVSVLIIGPWGTTVSPKNWC
jgi:hypothetical protein